MAEPDAKLSSLFAKKKKKKSTTVNANAIAKSSAAASTAGSSSSSKPAAAPAAASAPAASPTSTASPSAPAAVAGKKLSELTLGGKADAEEKQAFQWAKQPKKYKTVNEPVGVAKTWEEQEERTRVARRIKLDSERAFPTLGGDSSKAQLSSMKAAPSAKAVATKNVWASLHDDDEDED